MLRVGIIGAGNMAAGRARAVAAAHGATVVAVHSRRLETATSLAESIGAVAVADQEAFLAAVDAVIVAVPNVLHAEVAAAALTAGRHVLVEYPLCTDWADALRLRALSEQRGCVLMVGNTIVHEAMFGYVQAHRERLGELRSAASRVIFGDPQLADAWYMRPGLSGSVFAAFHYHHIEYYRRLLGEVAWIEARDEALPAETGDRLAFAGGTLLLGHESGATSCIQWYLSDQGQGLARGFWLTGTADSLTIVTHQPDQSLAIWGDGAGGRETFAEEWGVSGSTGEFLDAIAGDLNHRARLASDLRTLRIALAASDGRRVRVPSAA